MGIATAAGIKKKCSPSCRPDQANFMPDPGRGQDVKPYILWLPCGNRIILHKACSIAIPPRIRKGKAAEELPSEQVPV